ncbi:MAG: hypothetical protein NT018_10410, partial [Armatimonadetes bacterium]|nr:hypothetical protein [Armatimonadota bacterium]
MNNLFVSLILFVFVSLPCIAGPNKEEMKFFQVLAPDYSKTSGGSNPAISPDGNVVAYQATSPTEPGREFYILSNVNALRDSANGLKWNDLKQWKLEYPKDTVVSPGGGFAQSPRNLDWSPDGKRLAFADNRGMLYMAESFDFEKQTAQVRVLAKPASKEDPESLFAARWSPDSASIAYLRYHRGSPAKVCVVDVESGQERVLATDATPGPKPVGSQGSGIWGQPWSPDGKRLVYATGDGYPKSYISLRVASYLRKGEKRQWELDDEAESRSCGISIVSVDGMEKRPLECGKAGLCPSWSPKGDKILFTAPIEIYIDLSNQFYCQCETPVIWMTDMQGKEKTAVTNAALLSAPEAKDLEASVLQATRQRFLSKNQVNLTANQIKALKADKTDTKEMISILTNIRLKEPGADTKSREKISKKAAADVWVDLCESFGKESAGLYKRSYVNDSIPVWSPDGKRIAFLRSGNYTDDQLVVKNLETGDSRVLAEENLIECFSWAKGGDVMIMQTSRVAS